MIDKSDWRIFFWAALHSQGFRYCRVYFPLLVQLSSGYRCNARFYSIEFHFRKLSVYVPSMVRNEFFGEGEYYDDIPF